MPVSGTERSFEDFALQLVEVFARLPMPMAIALDVRCRNIRVNDAYSRMLNVDASQNVSMTAPEHERTHAYRCLRDGIEIPADELPMQIAAATGHDVSEFPMDIERSDGTIIQTIGSAWPLRDDDGVTRGSVGVFTDITRRSGLEKEAERARNELRAAEERYRLIAEAMPQFVWIDAPDGSAVYANRRWLDYIGMSAEQNAGFGWTMTVHPEDAARLDPIRSETLRTGEDFEGECRYKGRDGKYRWFLFRSIPVRDEDGTVTSWVGTATDIDRQKRAEEQQKFFATASEVLGSTLDQKTTLERIARLCVPGLADWCQIDLFNEEKDLETVLIEHANEDKNDALQVLVGSFAFDPAAIFGPPFVARTGEPQMFSFIDAGLMAGAIPDPEHRKLYNKAGHSSAIIVPLKRGETVYGALTLMSADPARLYTNFDLTTALEFARRGAIAMEHSRIFEREHLVATTLQRALLPTTLPELPGVRFSSAYAAAVSGEEVGGDWYDAFELPNGRIALSIGDVAGHGLEAAVTMGTVRQAIRAAALERSQPHEVLHRANAALALDKRETMVTAIFATYEPHTRILEYAVAGHPRPLVAHAQGAVTPLEGNGPPLGTFYDTQGLEMMRTTLPKGCSVVFFTDGLIEYDRDIDRAEHRLYDLLQQRRHIVSANPASEIIDRVLDAPQRDDIAVLVMALTETAELIDLVLPATPASAPAARALMREFAQFHGLDENRTFDLLCISGEAVSNAIEHPYADQQSGIFRLRAAYAKETVSLEVSDRGRWRKTVSMDRGRGFTIMRSIAKTCEVARHPNGTSVHLTL